MVRAYLRDEDGGPTPLDRFAAQVDGRKAMVAEVERRLAASRLARLVPWKRWLFRWLLGTVHDCLPLRENEKHYALRGYLGIRRVLLEIGRRLVPGHLQVPEDVFFLTWSELEEWEAMTGEARLGCAQAIPERRRRWEALGPVEAPFIVRSDGLPVPAEVSPEAEAGVLRGTAASPGRAVGRARVVREAGEGVRLIKGEILVAPTTDPGWTPLFLNAAGLVMEVGGVLCHGAIVAREYGLPAVVGVSGATDRIRDGDEVIVDGSAGTVGLPSTSGNPGEAPAPPSSRLESKPSACC
jgi:pyruvate,water dikinase